jgi:hypothetical protein
MGRPRKVQQVEVADKPSILSRLRIYKDYVQYIAILDLADVLPFTALKGVETVFPKIGLVIKRQFGFLGYSWGYGKLIEHRPNVDSYATLEAPVSLHIYFQHSIDDAWLSDNAERFQKILNYIRREWGLYKGSIEEDY